MENTNNIIMNSRLIKDGQGLAHKAIAVSVESMKRLDNDNKKKELNQINNEVLSQEHENQMIQGNNESNVSIPSVLPEPMVEKSDVELTPSFNIPELKEPVEPTLENEQINQSNFAFIPKIEEPLYQPVNDGTLNITMPIDNNAQNTVLNPFDIAENNPYQDSTITNNGMFNMLQNNKVNEVKSDIIPDTTGLSFEANNGNNLEQTQIMPEVTSEQTPQFIQSVEASEEMVMPQFIQTTAASIETKPVQIEQISPVTGYVNESLQNNNEHNFDMNGTYQENTEYNESVNNLDFDNGIVHQSNSTYNNEAKEESIDLEVKLDSILKISKALEDATRNLSKDIEIVRKIMENDKIRKNEFLSSLENEAYSQDDNRSISL